MKDLLYPLKFESILKQKIWGGEKLVNLLNKPSNYKDVGESWELSGVDGNISEISNGPLKGKTLNQILDRHGSALLGLKNTERFGNKFPLLIKFIDAKLDLSVQLHPGDKLAKERHQSFGKTEMWYVMQADKGAKLIVGFNQEMDVEKYKRYLNQKRLPEILNFDDVKPGDTYFIEAGRIHAIGAGVLLAEIQQTSDVTYRVYDWDRKDVHGNERELHNDVALDALNFDLEDDFRVDYNKETNTPNNMISCPYFTTNFIPLQGEVIKENDKESFIIYLCVGGAFEISVNNQKETLKAGETVLLPASISTYELKSKNAELLEVYIS